jgi:hypothetical protein
VTAIVGWLRVATERHIVLGALRVAMVVGTLLVAINHGDRLLAGTMTPPDWLKIGLTCLVPYCVATFAATNATLRLRRQRD